MLNSVWPSNQVPEDQDEQQKLLHNFTKMYRAHYDKFIKCLSTLNFQDVEGIWVAFWQQTDRSDDAGIIMPLNSPHVYSSLCPFQIDELTGERIKALTRTNFSEWIAQTDYTMYNAIITNLLLPNLLKPIPQILTQQIRNFAKCINRWMVNALQGYDGMVFLVAIFLVNLTDFDFSTHR